MSTTRRFALGVLVASAILILGAAASAQLPTPPTEEALIAVLESGRPDDKAIACKQLAIRGNKQACPHLAGLLGDPEQSSWARIALEVIPDPAADEALSGALDSLQGDLAIGVINSIGVRRDANSVRQLTARLQDKDPAVASAAAVALGQIASAAATASLEQAMADARGDVRAAVAEGYLLCADRLLSSGNASDAIAIFDAVRAVDVPRPRKLEATRGAILARGNDGMPLLVEQINSPHRKNFQLALTLVRELRGSAVAEAVAAQLEQVPSDRAALLVHALADRIDPEIPASVAAAAKNAAPQVRVAAIGLLGRRGDASHLPILLELAADENPEVARAARDALASLSGDTIDEAIVGRLPTAQGKPLIVLVETAGRRRIAAVPTLIKALDAADAEVRSAALVALGETIALQDLDVLIAPVVAPRNAGDADVAERALQAAGVRMADREACAAQIAAALPPATADAKLRLLKVLGAMGGPAALDAIAKAMQAGDDQVQDAGSRVLGEWMTADAAPVLLEQAKSAASDKYRIRALRGYLRIARQFQMPIDERAKMCRAALAIAARPDEKKLILQILERYPDVATLDVAIEATKIPSIADDSKRIAQEIATKSADKPKAHKMLADAGIDVPAGESTKVK